MTLSFSGSSYTLGITWKYDCVWSWVPVGEVTVKKINVWEGYLLLLTVYILIKLSGPCTPLSFLFKNVCFHLLT